MANDSRIVGNSVNSTDCYATPHSMTEALFKIEKFEGEVLEPACGEGHMAEVISKYNTCYCGDILEPVRDVPNFIPGDFLLNEDIVADNIITNPPFKFKDQFILKAKKVAKKKIAILTKLDLLHGFDRYIKLWRDREFPFKTCAVFVRRPFLGQSEPDEKYKTGMFTYAWFIWEKGYRFAPHIQWINNQKNIKSS